jgi:hypothetical protein
MRPKGKLTNEMDKLSIHVRNFNDKVRVMNQSQSKQLIMSAQDARNLHADIFALLTHIAELSDKPAAQPTVAQIGMDGGRF